MDFLAPDDAAVYVLGGKEVIDGLAPGAAGLFFCVKDSITGHKLS